MEEYLRLRPYQRPPGGQVRGDSRNGFCERDYVTPLGVIRLRIPRTRSIVVFTNVPSVDRIVYAIFHRFNEDWCNHALELLTQTT
jgi:hypothetical protein